MAIRIDGKALAAKVKDEVRTEAAKLPRKPGLAVILVGDNQASQVYVRGKEKDCAECGIESFPHKLPAETTQEELLSLIDMLDSRMEIYAEALHDVTPGQFSQRVFALEKRLYRHE